LGLRDLRHLKMPSAGAPHGSRETGNQLHFQGAFDRICHPHFRRYSVKICPQCRQAYADDMAFCLGDGSRLSPATPAAAEQPKRPEAPRSPATLSIGQVLAGRYRILRFIGKGGMGEVYEAEDKELRERIALKTILPEIGAQEESIRRFKQEIQLARKVTHPNVSRIFDLVYDGATIFLTMELLEGETLAARLRRTGAMSTREAFPLVAQIASALGAAHRVGIVHRDFKCENVMLVPAGEEMGVRAVVTDFGLARRSVEGNATTVLATAQGVILGTPAYMAPEQVEGHPATPAADLYALGVVMYEIVTGKLPFEGDTPVSTAVKRLLEPPPSPRTLIHTLDERWEQAILRCLARNAEERFQTAEEVIDALTSGASPAPHAAPSEAPRMLEAAAPKCAAVGRSMQLLAMIRRLESAGLKAHLDMEEAPALRPEDVRGKPFQLEFPRDRKGTPQPAEIILRLDSPDFEPPSQSKKLLVPVDRDSDVCTFLLAPRTAGELALNLEVLMGDVLVASRAMHTVAELSLSEFAMGRNVLVSIPLEVVAYGLRAANTSVGEGAWPEASQTLAASPAPSPPAADEQPTVRVAAPARIQTVEAADWAVPTEVRARPVAPLPPQPAPPPPRPAAPARAADFPAAMPPPPRASPPPPPAAASAPLMADFPESEAAEVGSASPPPLPESPPPAYVAASAQEPTGAFAAPPVPPGVAARSWTARNAKVLGLASLAVVLVCVVPLGYFMSTRSSPPGVQTMPTASPPAAPVGAAPAEPEAPITAPSPMAAPDPTQVKAKIITGDFYLKRGEYDDAIAAYQAGLQLDPSNPQLREKLQTAIARCKKENAILKEGLKCGEP
jgi:tRNA A-37 threonylcarbamoyl transferase component Bud32